MAGFNNMESAIPALLEKFEYVHVQNFQLTEINFRFFESVTFFVIALYNFRKLITRN